MRFLNFKQILFSKDGLFSSLSDSVPVELLHALDESEEGSIAVNLLPLLLASRNGAANKEKSDGLVKKYINKLV